MATIYIVMEYMEYSLKEVSSIWFTLKFNVYQCFVIALSNKLNYYSCIASTIRYIYNMTCIIRHDPISDNARTTA